MLRWWRGRGQADRFELYIQATLYANIVLLPLVTAGTVATGTDPGVRAAATALAVTVHMLVCALLLRAGIADYLGRAPRPIRLIRVGAASTALATGAAVAAYPSVPPGESDGPATAVLLLTVTIYAIALVTVIRPRTVLLTAGAAGSAAAFGLGLAQHTARPGELAAVLTGILLLLVPAARVTLWTLGMVRELERTRRVHADLAVAEERLRFARDMHDVLGRSLSVVAVKAELASRFAELGRPEATNEMIEVRRIAQEALSEMSAVVGGYRSADLGTELAGARALLTSAGIACRVEGSAQLPTAVQGSLGWVVREGTTNVLRHSQASECVITLNADARAVTLTVDNDGTPHGGDRTPAGNGLTGLTERITALGGTVTAGYSAGDRFRLEATVPVGTA